MIYLVVGSSAERFARFSPNKHLRRRSVSRYPALRHRCMIVVAELLMLASTGAGCSREQQASTATLGTMNADLRGLIEAKCKEELVETRTPSNGFRLTGIVEERLRGRPILYLNCPGTTITYCTDDGSLYTVSAGGLSATDANRWLDALTQAGMPSSLRERARQKIMDNKPREIGDPVFETQDRAVLLDVTSNKHNDGTVTWDLLAQRWK